MKRSTTVAMIVFSIGVGVMAPQALAQSVGVYRGVSDARGAAMASAGSLLADTPVAALSWNPAALASVEATQIDLALSAISARGTFANRVDRHGLLDDARGVVPEGAAALPFRQRRVAIAAGVLADGAIAGSWRYRDAPGAAGATYGLATHRSGVVVLRPTAGVGLQLGPRVSVGASVSLLWNRNELSAPYVFQTQAPLVGLKTMLDVRASGTGWGASLGAVATPFRTVKAGVSWRSSTSLTTRGQATGDAWAQFAAAGIAADSAFEYAAAVRNSFPSMIAGAVAWEAAPHLRVSAQLERWGWRGAFASLPITLSNGSNPAINGLVGSNRIHEEVPLSWNNQLMRRAGIEYDWRPAVILRAGYAYGPSPVPTTTLTPMTAAIVEHTVGVGVGLVEGKNRVDVGYQWSPVSERQVRDTLLQGSEYDNTSVAVGVQSFVVSFGRRF